MEDERVLERRLNGDEDPADLPLALLQHITKYFSDERKIGQGGFGAVYKGVLRNGNLVAVKRIDVNGHTIDDKLFRREFNSLRKINHQNVVRFLGFCSNSYHTPIKEAQSEEVNFVNIRERLLCFEYIGKGSLDKHITDELRGLEWETRYEIITGICKGLCYLHEEKNIVHMDLKPANILLDDHMSPKITDFGLSRPNKNSHTMGQRFGTRGYVAPEYETAGKISTKSDIYSLGAIIFELVTGCMVIPDKNNVLRRWRHRWNKPPTLLQIQQVTKCIEIAVRCREIKPDNRPSISEIISILCESDSTDGHTMQIRADFNEDDMLRIKPLKLSLPSEFNKEISCQVELINDSCNCIAFSIKRPSIKYSAQPDIGIVQAKSKYGVNIIVQPQERNDDDKFIVQSMKVSDGHRYKVISKRNFDEEDGKVDEVHLVVVYEPASEKGKMGSLLLERGIFSRHYPTNMKYLEKESDRAVGVARGAMGSLLDKLGKLVTEDCNLENSIKKDIESFSNELMKIHLELPKLENLDGVKVWVNEVRDMSYNIEDMVDGFLVHVEHDSNRSSFREVPHEGTDPLEDGNNHIGDMIRDIKNKVIIVANKGKNYNFDPNDVVAKATNKVNTDLRISSIYEDKEQPIGIEAPRDKLTRLLEEDGNVSKQWLKILCIVGMGGLGKTALSKAVYDKLQAQYHHRAFVTVGQNVDVKIVLKKIICQFQKDATNMEHLDVSQLIDHLKEFLKYKRYFVVIDDIWDTEVWYIINSAFPRNTCGSRVITTTRIVHVAVACCYDEKYVYVIKPLNDEHSRILFFKKIFGSNGKCPDALKEISTDILKRCGGMPLAINSMASLLAGGPESTWDYVRKNWAAVIQGNGLAKMKQILDLSYIHLPDHLKTCLLYVCMYSEDREIDTNDLLRKWVAEGFVQVSRNGGLDAEDIAEEYLKELINVCMIHPVNRDHNNEVLSCRVHPITLDLMRSRSGKENFIQVIDDLKDVKGKCGGIRRISVHCSDKEDRKILETTNGTLTHARSVLLYQSSLVLYIQEFKYVRVLHLEHKYSSTNGLDLTGISKLFLLRYLKVTSVDESGYELKLPDQIGELQELETIDLHNASVKKYPSDIVSLPWLRHLISTGNKASGVLLPDGVEKLKYLRTLVGVCVLESSTENIKGIGRLANLRKLQFCWKGIVKPSTMHMNALHSSISMLSPSLRILSFGPKFPSLVTTPNFTGWTTTPSFPGGGGSHIQELDLGGCEFQTCPKWISQLHNLCKFTITVREVADGVSIVAGLPLLAFFRLTIINDAEENEESVIIPGGGGAFKSLKNLVFYCQKASLTFEAGAMPKLQDLSILFRYHMAPQFLPIGIRHLPAGTLKEIWCCVAPTIDLWRAGALERGSQSSQVLGEHSKSLRHMLKRAFKPHHPGARIVFVYPGSLPVLIDQEDGDNEATSIWRILSVAHAGCKKLF